MPKTVLEEHKLTLPASIPFTWKTDNYGRAEFAICATRKRGAIQQVCIYPKQQDKTDIFYSIDLTDLKLYHIWLSSYEVDSPNVWQVFWCKDHKCPSINLYVPANSKRLSVTVHIRMLHITFWKTL